MIGKSDKNPQLNFFSIPLVQFINMEHELCVLAQKINWEMVEKEFAPYYSKMGAPAVLVRTIVGLILLKKIFNQSDESVIYRWVENPYWQYFCGETYFQKKPPFNPSDFVHFRKRIGEEGAEKILKLSIDLFGECKDKEVIVDTTVQEKNITYPTDTKLHKKIIEKCQDMAEEYGIELRQSYRRKVGELMMSQRFRKHPRSRKKAHAAARKLKTIAGRLTRELERKLPREAYLEHEGELALFHRVLKQVREDKNKIYSLHEPDVQCIAKGKEHKPYEFGNKSSIALTTGTGIIVGALAFKENVYDGNTLPAQLRQVKRMLGRYPDFVISDRGYRGRKKFCHTNIVTPGKLPASSTPYERRKKRQRCRSRAAVEPIIGHVKKDHGMLRNYLKGTLGDSMNTMLSAAAFNFRKMLNRIKEELKPFWPDIYYCFYRQFFSGIGLKNVTVLKILTF